MFLFQAHLCILLHVHTSSWQDIFGQIYVVLKLSIMSFNGPVYYQPLLNSGWGYQHSFIELVLDNFCITTNEYIVYKVLD